MEHTTRRYDIKKTQHKTTWHDTTRHNTTQHKTIRYDKAQDTTPSIFLLVILQQNLEASNISLFDIKGWNFPIDDRVISRVS